MRFYARALLIVSALTACGALAAAAGGQPPAPAPRARLASAILESLDSVLPSPDASAPQGEPAGEVTVNFSPKSRPNAALAQALRFEQEGQWRQAAELYQRLIDEAPSDLCNPSPRLYVSIRVYAEERLAAFPAAALADYRLEVDPGAQALFRAAVASGNLADLEGVARRFLLSSVGDDALDRLATAWLARGEAGRALRAWRRLLRLCPDTDADLAIVAAKLAACLQQLGRERAGADLLARAAAVLGPEAAVTVAGRRTGLAAFAALLRDLRRPPEADLSWTVPGGDRAQSRSAPSPVRPGDLAWSDVVQWKSTARVMAQPPNRFQRLPGSRADTPGSVSIMPVVAEGKVIYPSRSALLARDLSSGKLLWEMPWPNDSERYIEPFSTASVSVGHWSCTAGNGQAYCAIPFERTGYSADEEQMKGELVAVDLRTGAVRWRASANASLPGPLTDGWFACPPLPCEDRLVVGLSAGRSGYEYHLCALRASDGEALWRTFICSRPSANYYRSSRYRQWFEGMPAESDGLVVTCGSGGIVAAVELATGRVAWLSRYDQTPPERRFSPYAVQDGWATNTPLIADGVVYAAPPDSDFLYAIDLASGRLLWRLERRDHEYVAGVRDDRLYLAGTRATCVRSNGRVEWETELPRRTVGRPALGGHILHVPIEGGIVFLDAATGHELAETSWADWREAHESAWTADLDSGDLLIAAGRLFVATPFTLNVFAPLDPRPALERALAEKPDLPAVHYALGRERQWEGDVAAAAAAFEKTLELAASRPEALSETDRADARQRLSSCYDTLSRRQEEAGDLDMGLNAARAALRYAGPEDAGPLRLRLANLCRKLRRWAPALEAYQQVLSDADPGQADWERARQEVEALLREAGRKPYEAADAAAAAALREGAEPRLLEIVRLYPNSLSATSALLRLAALAEAAGRAAEARLRLRQLVRDYPASAQAPEALYRLALSHARQGARAMARGALASLRRTHPGWRGVVDGKAASADLDAETLLAAEAPPAPVGGASLPRVPLRPPFAVQWDVPQEYGSSELYVAGDGRGLPESFFALVGMSLECRSVADGRLRWADRPGWMGVRIEDAQRPGGGVYVTDLIANTPAERAGLRQGDILVEFDRKSMHTSRQLVDTCLARRAGTTVGIRFLRDGDPLEARLQLGERPTQASEFHLRPGSFIGLAGGSVVARRPSGLLAVRVADGERAWSAAVDAPEDDRQESAGGRSAAAAEGIIALTDHQGRLLALDPDGGRTVWSLQLDEPSVKSLEIWEHGIVVASERPAALTILNPFDGHTLFREDAPHALTAPVFALDSGDRLCYAVGSTLACVQAGRAEPLWSVRIASFTAKDLWVAGPTVLAHGVDDRGAEVLECRRLATGAALWNLALARGETLQRAVLDREALYALTRRGTAAAVRRFDAATGKVAWTLELARDEELADWDGSGEALCLGLTVADLNGERRAELLALDKHTGAPRQRLAIGAGEMASLQRIGASLYAVVEGAPRQLMPARDFIRDIPGESPRFRIVRLAGPR